MSEIFKVNEEVEYFSQYDHNWKTGMIGRFTEDGMTIVAIIREQPDGYQYPIYNRLPLTKEHIRKVVQ